MGEAEMGEAKMGEAEMGEDEIGEDEMGEDEVVRGPNDKRTIWQEDEVVNGRNDWGLIGLGPFGKRMKWSMAEMEKDQMLEAEMAKDEMGEDEVAWYLADSLIPRRDPWIVL